MAESQFFPERSADRRNGGLPVEDAGLLLVDNEAIHLIAGRGVFVVPALNYQIAVLQRGPEFGFPADVLDRTHYREELVDGDTRSSSWEWRE